MLPKPIDEVNAARTAGGEVTHEVLLFINGGVNIGAVEQEERCHRRVRNALVAVHEWMPLGKRKAQRSGLLINVG